MFDLYASWAPTVEITNADKFWNEEQIKFLTFGE